MTGDYIDVDGLKTYYEVHGQGEPLLMMHGGFGSADSVSRLTAALATRFRVIVPERRGHGHTADVAGPITYDLMTEDTIAFMSALGIQKAHLVGYSDGGILCLLIAMRRPDLVGKIVPIAANFHHDGLSAQGQAFIKAATPEIMRMVIAEEVEGYDKYSPDGPEHFPVVFEKLKHMFLTQPALTVEQLSAIRAPALVVAADRDLMTIDHTMELFKAIPGAQLMIVPAATHALIFEKPDAINEAMLAFL
jgi:pimeloyl-ACP methyl ester carboxylesterase